MGALQVSGKGQKRHLVNNRMTAKKTLARQAFFLVLFPRRGAERQVRQGELL
jgi:hypothetical protein